MFVTGVAAPTYPRRLQSSSLFSAPKIHRSSLKRNATPRDQSLPHHDDSFDSLDVNLNNSQQSSTDRKSYGDVDVNLKDTASDRIESTSLESSNEAHLKDSLHVKRESKLKSSKNSFKSKLRHEFDFILRGRRSVDKADNSSESFKQSKSFDNLKELAKRQQSVPNKPTVGVFRSTSFFACKKFIKHRNNPSQSKELLPKHDLDSLPVKRNSQHSDREALNESIDSTVNNSSVSKLKADEECSSEFRSLEDLQLSNSISTISSQSIEELKESFTSQKLTPMCSTALTNALTAQCDNNNTSDTSINTESTTTTSFACLVKQPSALHRINHYNHHHHQNQYELLDQVGGHSKAPSAPEAGCSQSQSPESFTERFSTMLDHCQKKIRLLQAPSALFTHLVM